MMQLFDQEYAMERYGDEREANGEKNGEMKKARETAYELANRNMSAETIADIIKVSIGTVQKWLDERLVTA